MPISIVGGLIAGSIGRAIFSKIWGAFDEEEPPTSKDRDVPWLKVIIAAALQGAVFRATKTAVDRGQRMAFANVTGTWPGEKRPDPE